jgi:hypothetical protein
MRAVFIGGLSSKRDTVSTAIPLATGKISVPGVPKEHEPAKHGTS